VYSSTTINAKITEKIYLKRNNLNMPIKERTGVVISDKMEKTIVVSIESRITHKKYGKVIVKTKKYKVHDENSTCQVGDLVTIIESRPLSRTKRWTLGSIKQKSSRINISNIGE
jgi:small subunit ribosomal protein S17